jgi:hypothetical protein
MQLKSGLISEFLGDFNFRTFDQAVLALNVQKSLEKINFKLAELSSGGRGLNWPHVG